MSKGHRHASMMMEYAKIAAEHKEPWLFFQCRPDGEDEWLNCCGIAWDVDSEYRLKPRTIRIGEIDAPEPMRSAPEVGSSYFFVDPNGSETVVESEWCDNWVDRLCLRRGMCHKTKEDAMAHAKALILVSWGAV